MHNNVNHSALSQVRRWDNEIQILRCKSNNQDGKLLRFIEIIH